MKLKTYTQKGFYVNSTTNQRIKQKFVQRDVYACVTHLIEFILANPSQDAPFTIDDVDNLYTNEDDPQEVLEWWIVDNMLGEDLLKRGEPIINDGFHYYWGRTCSGQAILLDCVISKICFDLEILEGQENEWKV